MKNLMIDRKNMKLIRMITRPPKINYFEEKFKEQDKNGFIKGKKKQ